ncbi:MAG TPA: carboxylating nicotinate-nucleotide diphosphorylase [Gemmatimonadales bacterium]|nr:carboxylating nicotinate-nucleotide diphosphorylase [Gemmatimonadales bacterium]
MLLERDLRSRLGPDAARVAAQALAEDGAQDITSNATVPASMLATGTLEFRTPGILAGTAYADAVATAAGLQAVTWLAETGTRIEAGNTAGLLRGNLRAVLRAERPLLNLLQRAVAIATTTATYVEAVRGTGCKILHTRKTAPGLRLLDVSAVLAGGGHLHRLDLATTVMVKDNHWRALEASGVSLPEAMAIARSAGALDCQVEVESLAQVELACAAGAVRLLIDNQLPETVRAWGKVARSLTNGITIEATGGITLANIREYAEAGADYISIGALTHSVRAADVSLEITETG